MLVTARIVIEHRGVQREVDLVVEGPDASVADVVGTLGGEAAEAGVLIDHRFFGPEVALDEIRLYEGALVRVTSQSPGQPAPARRDR